MTWARNFRDVPQAQAAPIVACVVAAGDLQERLHPFIRPGCVKPRDCDAFDHKTCLRCSMTLRWARRRQAGAP